MSDPNAPKDPDPLDPDEVAPDDEELTDVAALEPAPVDSTLVEEEERAAAEAGAIGGVTGERKLPEAERPLAEAGEGEAEGFEQAEADLIEAASHGDAAGNPLTDRFTPEEAGAENLSEYGEADREYSSEDTDDDH